MTVELSKEYNILVNNTPIPQQFAVTMAALRSSRHVNTQKGCMERQHDRSQQDQNREPFASQPSESTSPIALACGRLLSRSCRKSWSAWLPMNCLNWSG